MTKNSLVPVPVRLPISELDVKRAIDQVKAWSSAANHNLEPKYNRAWVQATVEKRLWVNLWENNLDPILRAIELAEKGGDEIFDAALRRVHVEMQAKVIGGSKIPDRQGYQQVWLYGSRAMLRGDFHKRQRRRWDQWLRNIQICRWVWEICREYCEYGLRPTRNRGSRRVNRNPSGCSIVAAALGMDESNVQEHLWRGWAGELLRSELGPIPPA